MLLAPVLMVGVLTSTAQADNLAIKIKGKGIATMVAAADDAGHALKCLNAALLAAGKGRERGAAMPEAPRPKNSIRRAWPSAATAVGPSGQTVTRCPNRGNSSFINSCSEGSSSANNRVSP